MAVQISRDLNREFQKEINAECAFIFKFIGLPIISMLVIFMAYMFGRADSPYVKTMRYQDIPQLESGVSDTQQSRENQIDSVDTTEEFVAEYIDELMSGDAFRIAMKLCKKACGKQYYKDGHCAEQLKGHFALVAGLTFFAYDIDVLDSELAEEWRETARNYNRLSKMGKQTFKTLQFGCK